MLKNKRSKNVLVGIVIFSMIAMYGYMPVAKAAGLTSAKDTISNSDLSASGVSHTVVFRPGVALTVGTVITVAFNAGFTNVSTTTASCPSDATVGGSAQNVTCTVVSTLASTSDHTITVPGVSNPATANSYDVTISHNQSGAAESSQMLVYIISDVTVSAHVNASLTFEVATTSNGFNINGVTTTGTSSPTAVNFGTVAVGVGGRQIIGQTLKVATNANTGYVVTAQQDHNMTNGAGGDIDPASSTKSAWVSPSSLLADTENKWGYVGITSSDTNNYANPFASAQFQGLSTTPLPVMGHNGPADASTAQVGVATVGYEIEISALQEAGDYSNSVVYVCTPTF